MVCAFFAAVVVCTCKRINSTVLYYINLCLTDQDTIDVLKLANTKSLKPSYSLCYFKQGGGLVGGDILTRNDDLDQKDIIVSFNKSKINPNVDGNRKFSFRFDRNSDITIPTKELFNGNTIAEHVIRSFGFLFKIYFFSYPKDDQFPFDFTILATFRIAENTSANILTVYDSEMQETMGLRVGVDIEFFYEFLRLKLSNYGENRLRFNDGK
jgi:hypothetical protein